MRVLTAIGLCDEHAAQAYKANANTNFKVLPGSIGAEKHQFVDPAPQNVRTHGTDRDLTAVSISTSEW